MWNKIKNIMQLKINLNQRNSPLFKWNDSNNKIDGVDYYVEDDEEPKIP
jgi:hypothetical protein